MEGKRRQGGIGLAVAVALIYVFLLLPIIIVVLAAFNAGEYLSFPPQGFSLRWFEKFFSSEPFVRSFIFSLRLAFITTCISTVIGTMASFYVVRYSRIGKDFLRVLHTAPMMLPGMLTGTALLIFFYTIGLGGTYAGLLLGHVLVTMPYVFLAVSAALYNFDRSLEEAARSLGARPFTTLGRITLPLIKGGIISGAMFSFITSFDQFPISLLLSGVGMTPLPIQVFDYLRFEFDPTAAAVGTVTIVMTAVIILVTEKFVGLESMYWGSK
ncbi:ABC transporter permease [Neomoorella mulderi]|uniref:Inner membrane ABC transporter permease protein YdcV n=1 Tax=Moorella mulderi DSM 14980 TaxID=1122241 RepID=A0A151AVN0_9FIRM|nr:ABC transporter permease [Moorella mulderi]KYH31622.1 inner membrane ABC transporter permease protein YdcV [Moorella mulderi DSM 14980]